MSHTLGFSLIELMVVIAIVALLAAVAAPMYMSYIDKSNIVKSFGYADTTLKNLALYYQTHGAWPDTVEVDGVVIPDTSWTNVNRGIIDSAYYRGGPSFGSDGYSAFITLNIKGLTGIPNYNTSSLSHSTVMFAVRDMGNGVMKIVCGQNEFDGGSQAIPLSYLPSNCQCTDVGLFQWNGGSC